MYIEAAEHVSTFVRLTGDDLKGDPDLAQNGIIVGLLFRQKGTWAFASTMKGMQGRTARDSLPHVHGVVQELMYPANNHWDETAEQNAATAHGDFARPGLQPKVNG